MWFEYYLNHPNRLYNNLYNESIGYCFVPMLTENINKVTGKTLITAIVGFMELLSVDGILILLYQTAL